MNTAKLFLYDFTTNKKILKYGIAIALFSVAAFYHRANNPGLTLHTVAMSSVGLSMAFLTTLYSILSYSTIDRIKAYLMLPCKKSEVFFSFIFTQFFVLILERMSFVMIVVLFFVKEPLLNISYLMISALVAVVLDTIIVMSADKKKTTLMLLSIVSVATLYVLLIYSKNHIINFVVLAVLLIISFVCLTNFEPKHLAISRESKIKSSPFRQANYFFLVLMREKSVLINTVFVFVFACIFMMIAKNTPILLGVVWCIFSVNTPVTTMFSGDKAIVRQEKMLPRHSRLMNGVYGLFLAVYFAVANAFAILLFALTGELSIAVIVTGIVLVFLETGITLILERKYPIRSWQKKQEVWRNPRKYILPIIVFAITSVPYFFGAM